MALFKSGNPTLSEKIFDKAQTLGDRSAGVMSVRGTMNKFGFLLAMVIASASYSWHLFEAGKAPTMTILMIAGAIGGLVAALVVVFKPNWAPFVAPAYGILQGFFVGGISAIINDAMSEKYPGIVMQAVGLTFGVAIAMFAMYNARIIQPTQKFKSIVIASTMGIAIFYFITILLNWFGVSVSFMYDSSWLSIGISLFVVVIASLNLILDFDMIEQGAAQGAPKFMEWFGAFGLLVTIVWLYIEMLKLLSRLGSRD